MSDKSHKHSRVVHPPGSDAPVRADRSFAHDIAHDIPHEDYKAEPHARQTEFVKLSAQRLAC